MTKELLFDIMFPIDGKLINLSQCEEDGKLVWYVNGNVVQTINADDATTQHLPYIGIKNFNKLAQSQNITTLEWHRVDEKTPVIPEGKYGVQVFVVEYDHVYEEESPGRGKAVIQCVYSSTTDKNGDKLPGFVGARNKFDFMFVGSDGEWGPLDNKPIYWAYVPDVNFLQY